MNYFSFLKRSLEQAGNQAKKMNTGKKVIFDFYIEYFTELEEGLNFFPR